MTAAVATVEADQGAVKFTFPGGRADAVAKAVEQAIGSRRAPIRMRMTPWAHVLVTLRRLVPDRVWDAFVSTQFERPRSP